jgi:hypothetical protein
MARPLSHTSKSVTLKAMQAGCRTQHSAMRKDFLAFFYMLS